MSPEWAAHVINSGMTTTDENGNAVLDEAKVKAYVVELAKKYGQDESPAFINGILAKLV